MEFFKLFSQWIPTRIWSTEMYSETLTCKYYFEQNGVESLKQNKALMGRAEAAGFTYLIPRMSTILFKKETIKTLRLQPQCI